MNQIQNSLKVDLVFAHVGHMLFRVSLAQKGKLMFGAINNVEKLVCS